MILLPQQFQALVYHFFSGWLFALTWSGMNRLTWTIRKTGFRWLLEMVYFFMFVTLMYAGLIPITGGQTQVYLLAAFFLGMLTYLKFYAMTFSPLFEGAARRLEKMVFGLRKNRPEIPEGSSKQESSPAKQKRSKAEKS